MIPFKNTFLVVTRKSCTQVKTHLMTKDAIGACARSIGFEGAVLSNMAHQIEGTVACELPSLCKGRYYQRCLR